MSLHSESRIRARCPIVQFFRNAQTPHTGGTHVVQSVYRQITAVCFYFGVLEMSPGIFFNKQDKKKKSPNIPMMVTTESCDNCGTEDRRNCTSTVVA